MCRYKMAACKIGQMPAWGHVLAQRVVHSVAAHERDTLCIAAGLWAKHRSGVAKRDDECRTVGQMRGKNKMPAFSLDLGSKGTIWSLSSWQARVIRVPVEDMHWPSTLTAKVLSGMSFMAQTVLQVVDSAQRKPVKSKPH